MIRHLRNALAAAAFLFADATQASAPQFSLTPVPAEMTVAQGEGLTLPAAFIVAGQNLPDDMAAELDKFVEAINAATGLRASVGEPSRATITVALSSDKSLGSEGYTLKVTPSGAAISAPTATGLFYAFQTVKKLLPPNVMAGVADPSVSSYVLPEVSITDHPAFPHRGFELDCARHFHSVDQVKRMLDIMSFYKMNRFHWHLTDDQGWRVEIEKYPRLLSVGSIAPDVYLCDFATRSSYLLGAPYGPHYYTKAELKEIVEYAAERHIEVFPEIDMPGHMVAAIAAYPEFSCNPDGAHTIWYRPGVSDDVLNVASPAVLQFCKDVVSELAEIFPSKLFHIGGDETPTTAWDRNADCHRFMEEHGMTSSRQLQSWFMHQIADHLKTLGKQAVCWNEVVTSSGADLGLAKEAGFLIYDWLGGGTAKAAELGLNSVYCRTSTNYLDYPQGNNNEPRSMGSVISLPTTYNGNPDISSPGTCIGVQGNLWTEYISDPRHVEYNALPRLIAIAETGWSPREKKDFADFQRRITADTTLWNYRGYAYGRHHLLNAPSQAPAIVMPDPEHWVTVITRATNRSRSGRVLELVADGSPLISSLGASAGLLWSGDPADKSDWQQWRFIPDPENPSRVALVCKARPEGSVNPDPGSTSTDARWKYDDSSRHYNFILGEGDYYSKTADGYVYSIRSDKADGFWLNCGTDGGSPSLMINCWNNPADGDGGLWLISDPLATDNGETHPAFEPLKEGSTYVFANAAERFGGAMLAVADDALVLDASRHANVAWRVVSSASDAANVNTVTLVNASGAPLGALGGANPVNGGGSFFNGYNGFAVSLSGQPAPVAITRNEAEGDEYTLAIDGKGLTANASGVAAGGPKDIQPAIAGGAWIPMEVSLLEVKCVDSNGNALASVSYALPIGHAVTSDVAPAIPGYKLSAIHGEGSSVTATYQLTDHQVTYECRTTDGILIDRISILAPASEPYVVAIPEIAHFSAIESSPAQGSKMVLDGPTTITATFSTKAHLGAKGYEKKLASPADLHDGMSILIRDAHTGGRAAFRMAGAASGKVEGGNPDSFSPAFIWALCQQSDGRYAFLNEASGLYVGAPIRGNTIPLAAEPYPYSLTPNEGGNDWQVSSGSLAWDGGQDLTMHGWDCPGHPYWLLAPIADPYFKVTIEEYDADTDSILSSSSTFVHAGASMLWLPRDIQGRPEVTVTGADGLDNITADKAIRVIYSTDPLGIESVADGIQAPARRGVYDLQGRRLPDTLPSAPGLYIINGRKVLVK
ncbi:MAG: beta-N-acetylhexosaminidase [Pseudoflavonifractor sp.]|nr:beta-N-acetylhexosaminidase [Alloprevotella sp.]MCM1116198.1 beta-N-acetylhexosaminidase [Pseudoflavonifractor sp.]